MSGNDFDSKLVLISKSRLETRLFPCRHLGARFAALAQTLNAQLARLHMTRDRYAPRSWYERVRWTFPFFFNEVHLYMAILKCNKGVVNT